MLGRAVDQGLIPRNPAARIRLPRGQEGETVEMVILGLDDFVSIAERIHPHYLAVRPVPVRHRLPLRRGRRLGAT